MINQNKIITVWITKYALTHGIFAKKVLISETDNNIIEIIKDEPLYSWAQYQYHKEGKEWHRTKEAAIKKAEELRDRKIKSLERQIEKLKNMKFE